MAVSESIQDVWRVHKESPKENGWGLYSLKNIGSAEIAAGIKYPENAESLLIGIPVNIELSIPLPESTGFRVVKTDTNAKGKTWFSIVKRDTASLQIFLEMTIDIYNHLSSTGYVDAKSFLDNFIQRVQSWQSFMSRIVNHLSPEKEIGLFGELIVLEMLMDLERSPLSILENWSGPEGDLHDFNFDAIAFEVKTHLGGPIFSAKISSLDQLDYSVVTSLYLVAVQLEVSKSGDTLVDKVQSLISRCGNDAEAINLFYRKLNSVGFYFQHQSNYVRKMSLNGFQVIEVDENFPCLTRGRVPSNVSNVRYELSLVLSASSKHQLLSLLQTLN